MSLDVGMAGGPPPEASAEGDRRVVRLHGRPQQRLARSGQPVLEARQALELLPECRDVRVAREPAVVDQ